MLGPVQSVPAAELWALIMVMEVFGADGSVPHVVTDCDGVRIGVQAGIGFGTSSRDALARLWRRLWATVVHDDQARLLAGRIVWMSSHTSWDTAEAVLKSNGEPTTKAD